MTGNPRSLSNPIMAQTIDICSVPLRLTRSLFDRLVFAYVRGGQPETLWESLQALQQLSQVSPIEWSLGEKRWEELAGFEQADRELARRVHAQLLQEVGSPAYPVVDEDDRLLLEAYHTTPGDEEAGADAYFRAYCRLRLQKTSGLDRLARLAKSQAHWLPNHEPDIALYGAAALYWQQRDDVYDEAVGLLEIAAASPRIELQMDAAGLRGMFALRLASGDKGDPNLDEADRFFRDVIDLEDELPPHVSPQSLVGRHLGLTLARANSSKAVILLRRREKKKDPEHAAAMLTEAEDLVRRAITAIGPEKLENPELFAPEVAELGTLYRQLDDIHVAGGKPAEHASASQQINTAQQLDQIERPYRERYLEEARRSAKDMREEYYAMSVYNQGLGYLSQHVQIVVNNQGGAELSGRFTLQTMSILERIDTYLKTPVDGSVQYTGVEAVQPSSYRLKYEPRVDGRTATLDIRIDPALQPGEQLTYHWTAHAAEGTFAVTRKDLEDAGLENEYASWDITVPMKELVLDLTVPTRPGQPSPAAWFTVKNMGESRLPQAQMAYEAQLESAGIDLAVHPHVGQCNLRITVPFPRMAMRYLIAWKPF